MLKYQYYLELFLITAKKITIISNFANPKYHRL